VAFGPRNCGQSPALAGKLNKHKSAKNQDMQRMIELLKCINGRR